MRDPKYVLNLQGDILEFVNRCRAICAELGTIKPAYMCGYVGREGRVYDDHEIEIACEETSSMMEIRLLPAIQPANLENPVVMIMENGDCIRTHGEWIYAKDKVNRLFAALPKDPK